MQSGDTVLMAHGSGGTMMRDIIEQLFFEAYAGDTLRRADDAAVLGIPSGRMAFSTDTFVVTPHFFPGGDIGHLAICGTVNDVATSGAIPRYLSCGFVLEEGYPLENLRHVLLDQTRRLGPRAADRAEDRRGPRRANLASKRAGPRHDRDRKKMEKKPVT